MIEAMLESTAKWLDGKGSNSATVVSTQCRLVRNLADYPFPKQCNVDEKKMIESRIVTVLENMNFLSTGQYYSLPEIDETEAQVLQERQLISQNLIHSNGARGVYVREDQSFSLSINDFDHLTLVSLASGQQLQDIWNSTSLTDDTLAGILDFAFDAQRGYLTSHLIDTGIGLQFSAVLHLPALTMTGEIAKSLNTIQSESGAYTIRPEYPSNSGSFGDMIRVTSARIPGQSEMELLYHFTQTVDRFVEQEKETQKSILDSDSLQVEDRIERALGLARNARLLAFDEGLEVLSSLRLGVSTGLLNGYGLSTLNEIAIIAQDAHFQLNYGDSCDDNNYGIQRAQLFREHFAENT